MLSLFSTVLEVLQDGVHRSNPLPTPSNSRHNFITLCPKIKSLDWSDATEVSKKLQEDEKHLTDVSVKLPAEGKLPDDTVLKFRDELLKRSRATT